MGGRFDFFDTNVVLYLLDNGPKADAAELLVAGGGIVSVQVLNEALVNCIRKAGMSWGEVAAFLDGVRQVCSVVDLTAEIHDVGRVLGERHGFQVYDAMIVAAALTNGCSRLYSEDMHDGLVVEGALNIINPFSGL